jgi:hypothetical protein
MEQSKQSITRFAICIENTAYPASLELHKVYQILPDEEAVQDDDVRVIDESGEDYLYPAEYFLLLPLSHDTERLLDESFSQHVSRTA